MNFTPNTIVKLINCPLQEDNKNQIDFADVSAQTTYFNSRVIQTLTNFTYQRKEAVIRVPIEADNLYSVNYVMYDNANFSNKWFYAFVTEIEYINPNCTALHIKLDVWQTWQFALNFFPSFVIRQHSGEDNIRGNLKSEPINAQAFAYEKETIYNPARIEEGIVLYFSKRPTNIQVTMAKYNSGAITAQYYTAYGVYSGSGVSPWQALDYDLSILEADGEMDLIDEVGFCAVENGTGTVYYPDRAFTASPEWCKPRASYTPRNKKVYMYCYAELIGSTNRKLTLYDEGIPFPYATMNGELVCGSSPFVWCKVSGLPAAVVEYKGFPIASVRSSTYENSVNKSLREMNVDGSLKIAAATFSGFTSGGGMGAAASVVGATLNEIQKRISINESLKNENLYPDTMTGFQASSAKWSAAEGGINIVRFSPTLGDLRRLDSFFDMYGYTINEITSINFKRRPVWDYIETADIDIAGNLPQDDLQSIKNMFNKGVTFWHNPATFGDYSQNNAPT